MKKDNWENTFKAQAQEHSVAPPDHIWQNVESTLERKKKRFGFPFWFFGIILAFVLGFALVKMSNNSAVSLAETKSVSQESSDISSKLKEDNSINKSEDANEQVALNKSEDFKGLEAGVDSVNISNAPRQSALTAEIQSGNNLNFNSSRTLSPSSAKSHKTKDGAIISNNSQSKNNAGSAGTHKASMATDRNEIVQANMVTSKIIAKPNQSENSVINNAIVEISSNISEDNIIKNNSEDQSSGIKNAGTAMSMPVEITTLSADELEIQDLNLPLILFPKNVKCPTFSKKRIIPFVQLEVGAGPSMRHLTAEIETSKIYINKLATERPFYVSNATIHGGLILRNNITLHTGINYTMVKDKFDFEKSGLTQILITFDANNIPIDTMVRTGELIVSGENRFHLINIPVALGYQKKMGSWIFAGEVGIGVNVLMNTSGRVLYSDNAVHYLDEVDDFYKKSLGLSLNAALAIHYAVGEKTSIYLKPRYDMFLKDWTLKGAGFRASYDLLNVNIGIRRCF